MVDLAILILIYTGEFMNHHVCIGVAADKSKVVLSLLILYVFIYMNVDLGECNYSGYLKFFELWNLIIF